MREIKFRGKTPDGRWIYGNLIDDNRIVGSVVEWDSEYFCTEFWWTVIPETVGQYTGLKDKNGKEIYEGDILKVPDYYELPENTYMTYNNQVIGYEYCSYTLGGSLIDDSDYEYISEECEVIGNTNENHDLLPNVADSTDKAV